MRFTIILIHLAFISISPSFGQAHQNPKIKDYYFSTTVKSFTSRDTDTTFYHPQVWVSIDSTLPLGASVYIKVDSMPVWFKPGERRRAKPTSSAWSNKNGNFWHTTYKDSLQFSDEINFIQQSFLKHLLTFPLHLDKPKESLDQEWTEKIFSNENGKTLEYTSDQDGESSKVVYQLDKNQKPIKQQEWFESNGYKEYYEIFYHRIHFNENEIKSTLAESLPSIPLKIYESKNSDKQVPRIKIGDQFPDLELETLDGDSLPILNNKKLQLVEFWFLACPPCMKSIPSSVKLLKALNLDNQVSFTTINGFDYDAKQAVETWSKTVGLNANQVQFVKRETLLDNFGIRGFPMLYLIKNGEVVDQIDGWGEGMEDTLRLKIMQLLD